MITAKEKILKAYADFINILKETKYKESNIHEYNKYLLECKPYFTTTKELSILLNKEYGKQKQNKNPKKQNKNPKKQNKTKKLKQKKIDILFFIYK